eukprot:140303-Rhodomonas_salina.2
MAATCTHDTNKRGEGGQWRFKKQLRVRRMDFKEFRGTCSRVCVCILMRCAHRVRVSARCTPCACVTTPYPASECVIHCSTVPHNA